VQNAECRVQNGRRSGRPRGAGIVTFSRPASAVALRAVADEMAHKMAGRDDEWRGGTIRKGLKTARPLPKF